MATNAQSDITIKRYNTGNLAGKLALFFKTDKARKEYETIKTDSLYCLAYTFSDDVMKKAEDFCKDRQLHYEVVIIN